MAAVLLRRGGDSRDTHAQRDDQHKGAREWPSSSQGEGPRRKPTPAAPGTWTSISRTGENHLLLAKPAVGFIVMAASAKDSPWFRVFFPASLGPYAPHLSCALPPPRLSLTQTMFRCEMYNTSGSSNPSPTSLPLVLPVLGSRTHKRGAFFLAGVRHHFLLLLSFRSCCSKTGLTNTGKNCDQSPVIYTLK